MLKNFKNRNGKKISFKNNFTAAKKGLETYKVNLE